MFMAPRESDTTTEIHISHDDICERCMERVQSGWPLNDMESQYKFMVKHVQPLEESWRPVSMEYKPDIIISVHPLMQHIPLWVLKWRGTLKKPVFVTIITDFNTCHRIMVAKRALLDGLESSRTSSIWLAHQAFFLLHNNLEGSVKRRELEMDPKLPAVTLMGGGEGMGPVKKTAKALGDALFDESMGPNWPSRRGYMWP
ncbi:hypothetical protein IFM89_037949 [Coptis chinensis]|uniref:Diacylglycerol glucosyltransferase N-terminal domain-containing protein n=1 Tax=Coptis chinensis TaxID=261450 RepID=A0A835HMX9_9MAGN|nr:hypothetical protein IFM89_037949 [Coptis chinensis]